MKTVIRNFITTLTRFKMASALNLIGLTAAFTILSLVASSLWWEYNFNTSIPRAKDVYVPTFIADFGGGESKIGSLSRPLGDQIAESSPLIELSVPFVLWFGPTEYTNKSTNESNSLSPIYTTKDAVDILGLECVDGDLMAFAQPNTVIISESAARKLAPNASAVGQVLSRAKGRTDNKTDDAKNVNLTVVGVYRDMPNNLSIQAHMFENLNDFSKNNIGDFSFFYMYRLVKDADPSTAFSQMPDILGDNFVKIGFAAEYDKSLIEPLQFTSLYFDPIYMFFTSGNKVLSIALFTAALLIVLITLVNYINFFMALVPIRIRSVNINKVFGAPVAALRSNIVFESLGMMLLAYVLSLPLIQLIADSSLSGFSQASLSISDNVGVLAVVLLFTVIVGIVSGLFPAWYITKFPPMMVLKGSFGRSAQGRIYRSSLNVVQFVISTVLIVISLVVIMQNNYMQKFDYGYERDRTLVSKMPAEIANDKTKQELLRNQVADKPELESMAFSNQEITKVFMTWSYRSNNESNSYKAFPVSHDYPELMNLKIKEGRLFNIGDTQGNVTHVLINPIASHKMNLKVGDRFKSNGLDFEVVGIIENIYLQSLRYEPEPIIIMVNSFTPSDYAYFRVAKGIDMQQAKAAIEEAIAAVDPTASQSHIRPSSLNQKIDELYQSESRTAIIISVISVISIAISLLGVFGMIIFDMRYRRKEIALRIVFGSSMLDIITRFNRQILTVLTLSTAIALPLSWITANQWLSGFAYRIETEAWILIIAAATVWTIVLSIVIYQTYTSARTNPIKSLKSE